MSYAGLGLTTEQANRDLGWTKAKLRRYWDARAHACTQFADEGECLAQVARHVPVTIEAPGMSLNGYHGVGDTAGDVSAAVSVIAGLIGNPDATLRARGPALVQAVDTHLLDPLMDRMGQKLAPYVLKYVLPPLAVLYVLSGIAAYYSYQGPAKKGVSSNRRRGRRRRTSRRR